VAGTGPLAGLRVLDLTRLLPGGYATRVLADLGADVVKVEEPGRGDYLRWMPPFASTGEGAMHLTLNRGKRSVTCDLRRDGGREALRRLVADADVLVESYRPGVMDRLGVGYDALRAVNPRLVYVAITGYGSDGPYVDKAGHDIDYLGYAGALSFTGHPETGPWQPGLQIADLGGGAWPAVVATLAALRVRDASGEGQFCDVSMTDGVLSWLSIHAGAYAATGESPHIGREILNGGYACYGVYRCADGRYVAVGALEPAFFTALLDGLALGELAPWHLDPDRQNELRARIAEVLATKPRDEWVERFAGTDACVAPVNDVAEAFADPSAIARGMVVERPLADGTPFAQVGVVPRFAATPGQVGDWPAPLGADTDDVLTAAGASDADLARWRAEGAV
jgi:crotonobetainyl-CoA:carnitine CoA-transferase CaiB-like acyl-CoA transferase